MMSSNRSAKSTGAFCRTVILTLPVWCSVANGADLPIGVSFAENTAYQLGTAEVAGAPGFEHANWNNRGRWGNAGALNDSTGAATPVTMKWDATGLWETNADPALGGNHKLMKGYLDSNGAAITAPFDGVFGNSDDKPTVLLTGLDTWLAEKGFTSYSVVVYSDGDSAAGDRATRVWLASANTSAPVNGDPGLGADLTNRVEIIDKANWGTTPAFTRVTGTSGIGNYTVFTGLTAASFYLRIDEAGTLPWRAPVNGIQIIGTTAPISVDTDGDGLPDSWENNYGLDPADNGSVNPDNGASGDPDGDGRTNLQEYNNGVASTNPRKADTDDDGLNDGAEFTAGTDPHNPDTDGDTLPDGWEVANNLNPLDDGTTNPDNGQWGDPDNDQLANIDEYSLGTNPRNKDTDGDGYDDYAESNFGVWVDKFTTGTNPVKPDTDGDGILDGQENPDMPYVAGVTMGTDPNLSDTDGDGQNDRWEFLLGTNPTLSTSSLPVVPVTNPSFELPDVAGTYLTQVPTGWSIADAPELDEVFVENLASAGLTGGEGIQYAGIQQIGNYLYQDTGTTFKANTTYIVELAGGYRNTFPTGVVEFGLYNSNAIGTTIAGPGTMNLDGVRTASGNPDADNVINKLRDASALSTIGTGSLGRPFSFVTGSTPPQGNIVVYIRHASGFRVLFDNVRILAVPNTTDVDADGLPDAWELANRLSPRDNGTTLTANGPAGDLDNDGLTNAQELAAGTNPNLADTDGDGYSDSAEVTAGTSPTDPASYPGVVASTPPTITSYRFNGGTFEVVGGTLTATKTYTLTRSTTLSGFTAVGTTVTGVTTHTFTDTAPPAKAAFYRIEEVTAP